LSHFQDLVRIPAPLPIELLSVERITFPVFNIGAGILIIFPRSFPN